MKLSLKYKFLIPTICLLIAGMGTVSVVSHIKATTALTKGIENEIGNMTQTTVGSISSWIADRKLDIGNWSKQGIYKKALLNSFLGLTARTFANDELKRIKQDYGFYKDIVLADVSGDIVAASDQNLIGRIKVSDRQYFQTAREGNVSISKNVLKSRDNGNLVFMVSAPVMDKDKFIGVLFAVFDVNTFVRKFVDPIRIGENGYAYVFMEDGLIVSSRHNLKISGQNVNDFDFASQMVTVGKKLVDYELDGTKMIAAIEKLDQMNWTLVVCAVKNEIFLPVIKLGRLNSFATAIIALVVATVIILLTNSLSRPIKQVVSGLKEMGKGDLDFRLTFDNTDEIGEIGQALNKMAENLGVSNKKIKQQNILLEKARGDLELRVDQRTSELRRAEKKYRGIFENAIEGIFQTTPEGHIIDANPSFARILGYACVDEMLMGGTRNLFPLSKKEGKRLQGLLQAHGKIDAIETQLFKKDRQWFWCSISAVEISNEEDGTIYFEGFVVDITERREKEKAQREWKAAQMANHAKSEFLANMSHEIRTPLNALLGFSELLSVDLNDPKQESYIDAMRTAGKSLLTLINDILDLSKIEAGKIVFKYEPVNLKTLFAEIESIFKETTISKGIEFKIDLSNDLPRHLVLDETRIRQILLNLVGNAVKFTKKGYIRLTAEKEVTKGQDTLTLIIKIEDTGLGIGSKEQHLIFDSFTQVNGQINRKYGGTGLGLAICKRLTEAMGGQIRVESQLERGTTFIVSLKNVKISRDEWMRGTKEELVKKRGPFCFEKKKILVVDDIESNRLMLRELLKRFNQDVIEASNGQQALVMAKENKPDIIIMDIRMPVMDGNKATKQLKSDPDTKNIPVIAFTGDVVAKTKTGALKK